MITASSLYRPATDKDRAAAHRAINSLLASFDGKTPVTQAVDDFLGRL